MGAVCGGRGERGVRRVSGLAVVLCRSSVDMARECVKSLQAQTANIDILIVNNEGVPGMAAWAKSVAALDHRVYVMTCHTRYSVAGCWNWALGYAFMNGYGEALVVNDDTWLLPQTYYVLKTVIDQDPGKYGMVTAIGRREMSEVLGSDDPGRIESGLAVSPHPDFSCYMISKDCYRRVGPFDTKFIGAYFEDGDYHIRMRQAGVMAVSMDLSYLHHASSTLKNSNLRESRIIQANYDKNKRYFFEKHGCLPGTEKYDTLTA